MNPSAPQFDRATCCRLLERGTSTSRSCRFMSIRHPHAWLVYRWPVWDVGCSMQLSATQSVATETDETAAQQDRALHEESHTLQEVD